MLDYYTLLQLPTDIFQEKIKTQYRFLAKKLHPDNGGSDAAFKNIKEAYDILGDVSKRIVYDRMQGWEEQPSIINIPIDLTPEMILNRLPAIANYKRLDRCACDSGCDMCGGTRIREEEVELTFRDTHLYPDQMEIIIPAAGNISRYGKMNDGLVKMIYKFSNYAWTKEGDKLIYEYLVSEAEAIALLSDP